MFEITDEDGDLLQTLTTNSKGIAETTELLADVTYYIEEIEAPKGYQKIEGRHPFVISTETVSYTHLELGLTQPSQLFWATGALSSFLDNTPTYLVFLTTAGTLGITSGIATSLGTVPAKLLSAISCGAVFMGANTCLLYTSSSLMMYCQQRPSQSSS